jgi:hypothetical protein
MIWSGRRDKDKESTAPTRRVTEHGHVIQQPPYLYFQAPIRAAALHFNPHQHIILP